MRPWSQSRPSCLGFGHTDVRAQARGGGRGGFGRGGSDGSANSRVCRINFPVRLIPLTLEVCRSTAAQNAALTPVGSLGKLQPRGSQQVHASYEKSGFLRELEDANASLLLDLEKKDAEIRRLRAISGGALSARGEQATGEIVPAGMKDQRLVELAKKNRALTVQLEAERNKTSRQTREIKELSKELQVRRTHTDAGQDNGRHECPRRAPSIHGFMLPL